MKEYILDLAEINSREQLHDVLASALELPDHYGRNLDALYDCLTDMSECRIIFKNINASAALGEYGELLLCTLFRAASERDGGEMQLEMRF